MRGQLPKPDSERMRTNKYPPMLEAVPAGGEAPRMPAAPKGQSWHIQVRRWWQWIWVESGLPATWTPSDHVTVDMIAYALQKWYVTHSETLTAELRRLRESVGDSPMARMRLRISTPAQSGTAAPQEQVQEVEEEDPRLGMEVS